MRCRAAKDWKEINPQRIDNSLSLWCARAQSWEQPGTNTEKMLPKEVNGSLMWDSVCRKITRRHHLCFFSDTLEGEKLTSEWVETFIYEQTPLFLSTVPWFYFSWNEPLDPRVAPWTLLQTQAPTRLQNQFYRATSVVVCLNPQKCRCNLQIPEQNCPSFSLSQPGKPIHLEDASTDELRILLQTTNSFFFSLAWDDVVSPSAHQFSVVFASFFLGGGGL